MAPAITYVVCANGLGHFRRSTEILRRVLEPEKHWDAAIVCERWQRQRMQRSHSVRWLEGEKRVEWVEGVMAPGVGWSPDAHTFLDGRLYNWLSRLRASGVLERSELVISDNLPGVLEVRPDAVLQGSFLWSTVLGAAHRDSAVVSSYVEWERQILERYKPPMICVADFTMGDVFSMTDAVPLPWMCPDTKAEMRTRSKQIMRVAVLGGATNAADDVLADAAAIASTIDGVELTAPGGKVGRTLTISFAYEEADFVACDAAICRPALGTIHDCIAYSIPMICAAEEGNTEMTHNADVVERLGLGTRIDATQDGTAVREALQRIDREGDAIRARMRAGRKDGLSQAALWIRKRHGLLRSGEKRTLA